MKATSSTVKEIFTDYRARRAALVRALTRDFDAFFALCDPAKGNVCLYGHPDESWEVSVPKKVPPLIPDPAVGINFTSDGMDRRHWLFRVAIYSDSWLICVAFYSALMSSLNAADRTRLFTLINDLPTVYEAVKEWLDVPDKSRIHLQRSSDGQSKNTSNMVEKEEEDKATLCGSCAEVYYDRDELWIACDFCPLWYHVECVNVTPERAEKIGKYECPVCAKKRTKHRLQKLTGFSI